LGHILTLNILSPLAIMFYLLASGIQGFRLAGKLSFGKYIIIGLGIIAVVIHSILLYRWVDTLLGQNLNIFNVISMVTWLAAALVLCFSIKDPLENLALIIMPCAAISIVVANFSDTQVIFHSKDNLYMLAHILLSLITFSVLAIAAIQALFLALQNRILHHKSTSKILSFMPPLQTMENLLFKFIRIGFYLLSAALVTGLIYIKHFPNAYIMEKSALSIIAWFVFASLLWGRSQLGWRGNVATRWTLIGMLFLLLAYFGSKAIIALTTV